MLKKLFIVFTIVFILFTLGCASKVQTTVMRPAEIHLNNIKTIAIGNITGNTRNHRNLVDTLLTTELVNCGHFDKVLDRKNIEILQNEMDLALLGLTDEALALNLGKYIGASNMIFCFIDDNYTEKLTKDEFKNSKGETQTEYTRTGELTVKMYFKIINTETTEIIATKNISKNKTLTETAINKKPPYINEYDAWEDLAEDIISDFVYAIKPNLVNVHVNLLSHKLLPDNKSIISLMEAGATDEALGILYDAAHKEYEDNKIKAKANYNYGMVIALFGNYEIGLEYVTNALLLEPKNNKYKQGLTFIKNEQASALKLKQQQMNK